VADDEGQVVKSGIVACWLALALSGCMTDEQQQAKALHEMDTGDDAFYRRKADATVTYDPCRKNLDPT
jgi:hypothetical protein